jgi:hypothetical protein
MSGVEDEEIGDGVLKLSWRGRPGVVFKKSCSV